MQSIGYLGFGPVYSFQLEQVKAALRNCPGDPAIRSWDAVCQLARQHHPGGEGRAAKRYKQQVSSTQDQLWDELEKKGIAKGSGNFVVRYRQREWAH